MSKDSFNGTIVGTVERVRQYAKGDVVTVAFKANPNAQYPERVTVWAVGDAPVAEGQRVQVSGSVSWKVEEYNGKHYARVSLNFPNWGEVEPDTNATPEQPREPIETPGWDNSDSVPF